MEKKYCKLCDCYVRKDNISHHNKTKKHIRNSKLYNLFKLALSKI